MSSIGSRQRSERWRSPASVNATRTPPSWSVSGTSRCCSTAPRVSERPSGGTPQCAVGDALSGELFELAVRMGSTFEALGIPYVLGGSMASSLVGEPRATADLDVAVRIRPEDLDALLAAVADDFYVSPEHARDALRDHGSFNLIAWRSADKVDVFVLGEGLLDRRQIERRQRVEVAGKALWVTAVEDQVLRKLTWFSMTGETSERQWRDVVGILAVQAGRIDEDDLTRTAEALGLDGLLGRARADAAGSS